MKVPGEVNQAMETSRQQPQVSLRSGRYKITLASHDGLVVYTDSPTQKRILETAERIIAKANQKIAQDRS